MRKAQDTWGTRARKIRDTREHVRHEHMYGMRHTRHKALVARKAQGTWGTKAHKVRSTWGTRARRERGTWGTRACKARGTWGTGTRRTREHVELEARRARGTWDTRAREALQHVRHKAPVARCLAEARNLADSRIRTLVALVFTWFSFVALNRTSLLSSSNFHLNLLQISEK